MKLFEVKITIGIPEDVYREWSESRLDTVCEAIENEMDNLDELVKQKLSKIPESVHLYVEMDK